MSRNSILEYSAQLPQATIRLELTNAAARATLLRLEALFDLSRKRGGAPSPDSGDSSSEPDDDIEQMSEWLLRERAENILAELLESPDGFICYLRNGGTGRQGDPTLILACATDSQLASNQALFKQVGDKSLLLVGTEKSEDRSSGRVFLLFDVQLGQEGEGYSSQPGKAVHVEFAAEDAARLKMTGFPPESLRQVQAMAKSRGYAITVEERLSDWRKYLELIEQMARKKQFAVKYVALRPGKDRMKVKFLIDKATSSETWGKVNGAGGQELHLAEKRLDWKEIQSRDSREPETDSSGSDVLSGFDEDDLINIGSIVGCISNASEVEVELNDDLIVRISADNELPASGWLVYRAMGDLSQGKRLRFGLDQLKSGRAHNPRLSEFVFDATKARGPDTHVPLSADDLLLPSLKDNPQQLRAVEGALNAPDLFLIQGPPGTGKTTVIAEICYQIAKRGGRTLIASQANLAVDNAMSRLVHHSSIRALRRGRADRVEAEGASFLEENVVSSWLNNTAKACRNDLHTRRMRIEALEAMVDRSERIQLAGSSLISASSRKSELDRMIRACDEDVPGLKRQEEQLEAYARTVAAQRVRLAELSDALSRLDLSGAHRIPARFADLASLEAQAQTAELWKLQSLVDPLVECIGRLDPVRAGLLDNDAVRSWVNSVVRSSAAVLAVDEIVAAHDETRPALAQFEHVIGALRDCLRQRDVTEQSLQAKKKVLEENALSSKELRDKLALSEKRIAELTKFESVLHRGFLSVRDWLANTRGGALPDINQLPAALCPAVGREIWPVAVGTMIQDDKPRVTLQTAPGFEAKRSSFGRFRDKISAIYWALGLKGLQSDLDAARKNSVNWYQAHFTQFVTEGLNGDLALSANAERELDRWWADKRKSLEDTGFLSRLFTGSQNSQRAQIGAGLEVLNARIEDQINRMDGQKAGSVARGGEPTIEQRATAIQSAAIQELAVLLRSERQKQADLQRKSDVVSQAARRIAAEMATLTSAITKHQQDSRSLRHEAGEIVTRVAKMPWLSTIGSLLGPPAVDPPSGWSSWSLALQNGIASITNEIDGLKASRSQVDPSRFLKMIDGGLAVQRQASVGRRTELRVELARLSKDRDAALAEQPSVLSGLQHANAEWLEIKKVIPPVLLPATAKDGSELERAQLLVDESANWPSELAQLRQSESIIRDWIERLGRKSERDSADLRQVYIDNANVIGITCVQAGKADFSKRYRDFDCVIVDEVSKATPPELLLPILKGAKVVLVGDQKQLPPMIGMDTLRDLAEQSGESPDRLEHLKKMLFKELFENCPENLKCMLKYQYRMHPQIMKAINQFYSNQLECRIPDPDTSRDHQLAPLIARDKHILWLPTPVNPAYMEASRGTSFVNIEEIAIIESLVEKVDQAWGIARARPDGDLPPKELGVITFYGAQTSELKRRLLDRPEERMFRNLKLRIGTVDRFQGMERAVVIVSLVRNNTRGDIGFAKEPERINVAFSRAQELLVIVGSKELFCDKARSDESRAIYSNVATVVRSQGGFGDISTFR